MPKRKRDDEPSVEATFFRFRTDLFHALKSAKGFERQRQSKRQRDVKATPDKKARIDKEIVVLKSLDLHQTAHAHLCSSLLRFKAVAEAEKLPSEIRDGVPKVELTEEEKAALHNVTSSLYNRPEVKGVVDKAVAAVCKALGLPVPEKKGRVRGDKEKGIKEEEKELKKGGKDVGEKKPKEAKGAVKEETKVVKEKKGAKETTDNLEEQGIDEGEEEKAISELDRLLGLASDDENTEDEEEELLTKGRTRKPTATLDLDPMEITDEESGDEEGADLDPMEITDEEDGSGSGSGSEDEFEGFSDLSQDEQGDSDSDDDISDAESSASSIDRPPPAKKTKATKMTKSTDSTFLPTLMGGYISGSEEEASDLDIAPPRKNRRGQRARQALWEKKFGEKAKHLQQPSKARDSGWDLKRGAVDGDSKPWKRGIRNPLLDKGKATGANETMIPKKEPAPRQRDDSGSLHPSWEARRKAKEKELQTAPYAGTKITFD
ncbi:hypothetical protein N0V88_005486 [Collariella sp. IMI 366227]|nr:hypothetical protein N0V88_005486 [Collariella sp. IMI 366227]